MDEPGRAINEHHLTVKRTARYYTLGDRAAPVHDVWLVCHGFGQLARMFIEEFRVITRRGRLIVAPEALNRFYLNRDGGRAGGNARVGATWMTREDRLAEIDDYVRYLDDLRREVTDGVMDTPRVTALGFSQGTATVARWLVHGSAAPNRLILWAGLLPPDIAPGTAAHARLASADLHLVVGRNDEMMDPSHIDAQRQALERAHIPHTILEFDGGHRLDRETLQQMASDG